MRGGATDIGVNLADESFDKDRDAVIERAEEVGVTRMILTGTGVAASRRASELAAKFPGRMFSTAGVHPHDANSCDEHTIPALRETARAPHVVAVGECGLDYNRDFSPRDVQRRWFDAQADLAIEVSMPLFVHERDAHQHTVETLRRVRPQLPGVVVHCFTGDRARLERYLELDVYIGVTGWVCDERRGHDLQEAAPHIPDDRLLIETDAPYLLPRTIRPRPKSRRNEPSYLTYVIDKLAELRGVSAATIVEQSSANATALFGLPLT